MLSGICSVVGTPTEQDLQQMGVSESDTEWLLSLPPCMSQLTDAAFPEAPAEALHLLRGMLTFNHRQRSACTSHACPQPEMQGLHACCDKSDCQQTAGWLARGGPARDQEEHPEE